MSSIQVVLCVDDEEMILNLLEAVLTTHGYRFIGASNGREALRLAEQQQMDAVILDYFMPDINGDALAVELRALRQNTTILMFSGSVDIPPGALTSVDGFVSKGQGVNALITALQRLLRESSNRRTIRRYPRFTAQLPLAITVQRAGALEMLRGVATDVCEGGVGVVVEGNLDPGECVLLTIADSRLEKQLEPRAQVRYRKNNTYGFAFLDVSSAEQTVVRQFCGRLAAG